MDYNSRILAYKYAKAFCSTLFFDIGIEQYEQLVEFHTVLSSNKAMVTMMSAPLLDKVAKHTYCSWLIDRYGLTKILLPLIELLLSHERIALLCMVLQFCLTLYEDYHKFERFEIISASVMNNNDYLLIQDFLSLVLKKKIISKPIVDPIGLIGGIKAKSMNHCIDYSIAKKLRSARHMLLTQGITWK